MTLPPLSFSLINDRRGLPALGVSADNQAVATVPLTTDMTHPVTHEMAAGLVAPANQLAAELVGTELKNQEEWDALLLQRAAASQIPYVERVVLSLSLAGWRLQAKEAGQEPGPWLETAAWRGRKPLGPPRRLEDVWTLDEGGQDSTVRFTGAVGQEDAARFLWHQLDAHTSSGAWGGHQQTLTPEEWEDRIGQLPELLHRLGKPLVPALWFAPPVPWVPSWISFLDRLRPEMIIDPYPHHHEAEWDRLRREIAGRRLGCTIWISEDVWQGATLLKQSPFHGIVWQPQTAVTISGFIDRWRDTVGRGLMAAVAPPTSPVADNWWRDLAVAIRAAYCWNSNQFV